MIAKASKLQKEVSNDKYDELLNVGVRFLVLMRISYVERVIPDKIEKPLSAIAMFYSARQQHPSKKEAARFFKSCLSLKIEELKF